MTTTGSNLRKAAVLLRSLDSDTAAIMLAQLSAEEAASIRAAIRELGQIDPEEQADVAAEFHRTRPAVSTRSMGVELELSSPIGAEKFSVGHAMDSREMDSRVASTKRFEFLANAPTTALVPYLSREHAQTVAVVLAHLAADRAAAVLAALPEKLQSETIERLSVLGETDPESLTVLERELEAWMATRAESRGTMARRRETVTNILAATDAKTRRGIVSNLKRRNGKLAEQIAPEGGEEKAAMLPWFDGEIKAKRQAAMGHYESKQAFDTTASLRRIAPSAPVAIHEQAPVSMPAPLPRIDFDNLVHLDTQALTALLREVNHNVLAIALAGSREDLLDRICNQMPKRTGRTFRRELRRLGPMRLSDVEAAQRMVADAAARHLVRRRSSVAAA